VLHMLRSVVGEPAFRRALQALQAENRFGKIGTRDLQAALEKAGGSPLGPYFDAWIYGTRLPELRMVHRSERAPEGHRTVVEVVAEHLPGPLTVLVSLEDGQSRDYPVEVAPGPSRHTFLTAEVPRRVELNRDLGVLAVVR
jgi:aminopeptidase N